MAKICSDKRLQEIIDNQGKALIEVEKEILQAQRDMEKENMEEHLRLMRSLL